MMLVRRMNDFSQAVLTEQYAREICRWRYPGEYSVYNFSDWETVQEKGWDLSVKEKRESEYIAVLCNGELIAYGRISTAHATTYIGIGLKPESCGLGFGAAIMNLLINTAKERKPDQTIAVEVRSFNLRALACYKKIGFIEKDRCWKKTLLGEDEFIYLEYSED